jgi:uncharacterized protein
MARPFCCRRVHTRPAVAVFKPAGIPWPQLENLTLSVDELEALRLTDLEGLYQEAAGARMRVSRSTLARLVESARRKTADALVNGKALLIEGGPVHFPGERCRCGTRHVPPKKEE